MFKSMLSRRVRQLMVLGGTVLVGLSASVQPAAASVNAGAGVIEGGVSFYSVCDTYCHTGVPPVGVSCVSDRFWFRGTAAGGVVNLAGTEYAGEIWVYGDGGSTCASAGAEAGTLSVRAYGANLTGGTLDCGLSGVYQRFGTHVLITVGGPCTVNNFATGGVVFQSTGEFVPTSVDALRSNFVTSAAYAGAFTITPS